MSFRFAILGAGRIGQVHARAVAGNDHAVLAAVYDPVAAAASAISDTYGAAIHTVEEIAAADDIDIATDVPQPVRAAPLHELQVVGVVYNALSIGILVIDSHRGPELRRQGRRYVFCSSSRCRIQPGYRRSVQ